MVLWLPCSIGLSSDTESVIVTGVIVLLCYSKDLHDEEKQGTSCAGRMQRLEFEG